MSHWASFLKSACVAAAIAVVLLPCAVPAQTFDPGAIETLLKAEPAQSGQTQPDALPASKQPDSNAVAVEPPVPKPAPEDLYLSKDPQPTFTAETAALTEEAAQKYLAIVEAGGWPEVPTGAKLAPGATGPAVSILKQRLSIAGDLEPAAAGPSDVYDAAVEAAVKRFQERHGLEQTGAIGGQTLRALNITAIMRYNQLLASAKRLRASKFPFGPRYVTVNIPSANVEAVEDGKVVRRYIAVVGKADHPSPTVETKITSINLNPTWTVPASIVRNEIIPHMLANPGYLAKEHIRILDQTGAEVNPAQIDWANNSAASFTLRQDSGETNSLGTLRIDMPNRDAVYMHDTPSKSLFAASVRFQSHGCVRVSKVDDLAAWLLENNSPPEQAAANQTSGQSGWTAETIDAAITLGTRMDVKLTKPVPVAWVYLTGYATPDHIVHFRNDVYGLDNAADNPPTASIPVRAPQQQSSAVPSKPAAPAAKTLVE